MFLVPAGIQPQPPSARHTLGFCIEKQPDIGCTILFFAELTITIAIGKASGKANANLIPSLQQKQGQKRWMKGGIKSTGSGQLLPLAIIVSFACLSAARDTSQSPAKTTTHQLLQRAEHLLDSQHPIEPALGQHRVRQAGCCDRVAQDSRWASH
jgi:hypothetical protein